MKHMMTRDGRFARFSDTEARALERVGWAYISKSEYKKLAARAESKQDAGKQDGGRP